MAFIPYFLGDSFYRGRGAAGNHHFSAFPCEDFGNGFAYTAPRSSNNSNFTF
jgi:hypothetical protein